MAKPSDAGMITTEQAMTLLLTDSPGMKKLEREGAFRQAAPGRYLLKDLVRGFAQWVKDPAGLQRVTHEVWQMTKLDLAKLEKAFAGK